jgi:hypothetical protein
MSVIPVVRHLVACKKEPTMTGADPSAHDILYAIRPKPPFQYPIWLRSFYLFAMVADGQGLCRFHAEMRLVALDPTLAEVERLVGTSKMDSADLGSQPLRVRFLSVEMPAVLLPKPGVYRVYLNGTDLSLKSLSLLA